MPPDAGMLMPAPAVTDGFLSRALFGQARHRCAAGPRHAFMPWCLRLSYPRPRTRGLWTDGWRCFAGILQGKKAASAVTGGGLVPGQSQRLPYCKPHPSHTLFRQGFPAYPAFFVLPQASPTSAQASSGPCFFRAYHPLCRKTFLFDIHYVAIYIFGIDHMDFAALL